MTTQEICIDQIGHLHDDDVLRAERSLTPTREIIRIRLLQIGLDHAISCGSGYMTAVAPPGCQ